MKKIILLVLMILSVAFIFSNSLMDAYLSGLQSGYVLSILQRVAEYLGFNPARITESMVRKLAHFAQFALFGFLLFAYIAAWFGKIKPHIFMGLFFGLFTAVSDEFIQLFVYGRGSMVEDVVLDFFGFIFGMVVFICLRWLVICIKSINKK